jgi:phenylacetate-coenzyme A ligase PaaK-like adenylate-forming protein
MSRTPLDGWMTRRLRAHGLPPGTDTGLYQLARLRETLDYARSRSRFYRDRLAQVTSASIRSLDDVARLPFTLPEDLAAGFHEFLCVSPREVARIVTLATSGTTAPPKRIAFASEDQERTVDFFHHGMSTFTDRTDRVVVFMPGAAEGSVGDLLRRALARLGCAAVVSGPVSDYGRALETLRRSEATCVVGIPCQLLALSRYPPSRAPGKPVRPRSVLLSSDYVSPAVVRALEAAWGCTVYGHYGMTEMGLGGAVECRERQGYHLREADLLFEVVDGASGRPLPDGEYGEVVFSTLTRRAMPLIRYRTGDASRILPGTCSCGSPLRRLDRVRGRLREAVGLEGGLSLSMADLDDALLDDPGVSTFSAAMERRGERDRLRLRVHTIRGPADPRGWAARVRAIPVVDDLLRRDRLELDILPGAAAFPTTGTAKRRIADRRNPARSAKPLDIPRSGR